MGEVIQFVNPTIMKADKLELTESAVAGAVMLLVYERDFGELSNFGVFMMETILKEATSEQIAEATFQVACALRDKERKAKFASVVRANFDAIVFDDAAVEAKFLAEQEN